MIVRRYAHPTVARRRASVETESAILGLPAGPETLPGAPDVSAGHEPGLRPRLRVLPRGDLVAGGLLVAAGMAANVSLWLPWVAGQPQPGMGLVRSGFQVLRAGVEEPLRTGRRPGLAVVLSAASSSCWNSCSSWPPTRTG